MILDVLLLTPLVIEDILMMRVDFKLSVIVALKGGFSFSLKLMSHCKKICSVSFVFGLSDYKERSILLPE